MKTQLKNSLEKVQGVNQVCVDMARGSVEVMYNKPATQQGIRACIENSGHTIEQLMKKVVYSFVKLYTAFSILFRTIIFDLLF